MTFTTFESFKEWCIETSKDTNLQVRTLEDKPDSIMLENIGNTDPIYITEIVISAYDSEFILGGFFANEANGSLMIYV